MGQERLGECIPVAAAYTLATFIHAVEQHDNFVNLTTVRAHCPGNKSAFWQSCSPSVLDLLLAGQETPASHENGIFMLLAGCIQQPAVFQQRFAVGIAATESSK